MSFVQEPKTRARSRRGRAFKQRIVPMLIFGTILLISLLGQLRESGRSVQDVIRPSGELRMWVFDIGQGDAILLESPEGERMLVDGGPDPRILSKLGSVLPSWDRRIDKILVSHPHADHVAGLIGVFERYDVKDVYETGITGEPFQQPFNERVKEEGAISHVVQEGEVISFGSVLIKIIAPDHRLFGKSLDDANMGSVVLEVEYGETSILLTGDAPREMEEEIIPDLSLSIDVLKVAHHGSVYSTSREFLERIKPRFALISSGEGNSYGHPHPVLLERLRAAHVKIFRTDEDGDILVRSTGGEPTVEAHPLPF